MALTTHTVGDTTIVEGEPDTAFMSAAGDVDRVLEACFAEGTWAALLYAENLPPAFFDLSSGQAGAILQKLRNYGVRLAVVLAPGAVQTSSRFGEMVAEERQGRDFGLFATRDAAEAWLTS
jgi:MFS-type transporter involved in bile tolerance (Atg22 family)